MKYTVAKNKITVTSVDAPKGPGKRLLFENKKFEIMLTRHAKAYSSSGLVV